MKNSFVGTALIISFLAVLLVTIPVARAEESYLVYTEKDVYLIGETVHVFAKAEQIEAGSTITIENVTVYDPMNQTIVTWSDLNIVLADTNTIVQVGELTATIEGQHAVYAEATGCPIRIIRWFFFIIRKIFGFVVPELPIGTIIPVVSAFSALGSVRLIKTRRLKKIRQGLES